MFRRKRAVAGVLALLLTFGAMNVSDLSFGKSGETAQTGTVATASVNNAGGVISAHAAGSIEDYYDGMTYKVSYNTKNLGDVYDGETKKELANISVSGMVLGIVEINIDKVNAEGETERIDTLYKYGVVDVLSGITVTSMDLSKIDASSLPKKISYNEDCNDVISVTPKIEAIGPGAFQNATYLKEINLGSIQFIGDNAFDGLKYITVMDVPSTVINVGQGAFVNSGIKTLNFHNKLTVIPDSIASNTPLSKVTFEDAALVQCIGREAFANTVLTSFPITVDNKKTLDISVGAFKDCTQLASATLPDSVQTICGEAFMGCTALKSVSIGANCLYLGGYIRAFGEDILSSSGAFEGCSSLTTITLNNKLQFMGPRTFMNCTSLINAPKMPDTLSFESYDKEVMPEPSEAYDLTPDDPAVLLDGGASSYSTTYARDIFNGCTALKKIELPSKCAIVPEGFCDGCTSLTTVILNSKVVRNIANRAFADCKNLQEFSMLDYGEIIGAEAFVNCENLRNVAALDNGSILERAYKGCHALKNIEVTSGIFLNEAFADCDGLETAKLTTDYSFGHLILSGCDNLVDADLVRDRTSFNADSLYRSGFIWGGGQLSDDPKLKTAFIDLKGTNFIPSSIFANDVSLSNLKTSDLTSVEIVLNSAFSHCTTLKSLDLPKVLIVEDSAFQDCTSLHNICSGDITIQDYGNYSFKGCTSLTQKVNTKASTIGSSAFEDSAITAVDINGTVGDTLVIGDSAFANCDKLTSSNIEIPDGVAYSIGSYIFNDCANMKSSKFNGTEIPEGMYNKCGSLVSVTIPEANDVLPYAFAGCTKLDTIDGVKVFKTIDQEAFSGCEALMKTYADANTTYKGDSQYVGCKALKTADVYGVTDNMFKDCASLTNVKLSTDISVLEDGTFDGCTSLASINLDKVAEYRERSMAGTGIRKLDIKNVNEIGPSAFAGCKNLHTVSVIADSIEKSAFRDCSSLSAVSVVTNTIGESAFYNCGSILVAEFPKSSGYTLRSIGDEAFSSDLMLGILIPDTVTSIGYNAIGYTTSGDPQKDFVVYGTKGTEAETYAIDHDFTFEDASKYNASALMSGRDLKGDVDANGVVSVIDIIKMQKWLLRVDVTGIYGPNMDMNGDNVVDVFDLALLKREVIKQTPVEEPVEEPVEPIEE